MKFESVKLIAITLVLFASTHAEILTKRATFSAVKPTEASSASILLKSFLSPSELACSQKCLRHDECNFKKYSPVTKKCELLRQISKDDIGKGIMVTKKDTFCHDIGPRCPFNKCDPGFECKESCTTQTGYQCINVNECASNPCQNGGVCTDGVNQYTCTCARGFSGAQCQITPEGDGWLYGDGIGGSELNIGLYDTKEACLQQCSKTTSNGVYANGATVTIGSPVTCYCEFGMTERRSVTSSISAFISPSCTSYLSLTEANRYVNAKTGTYCDYSLTLTSYRFSGAAGTKMPTSCVTPYYCSSRGSGWIQGTNPLQAEGVVDRKVCFSWSGNCCYHSQQIKVRNCGSFYVYELPPTSSCRRYCGTN